MIAPTTDILRKDVNRSHIRAAQLWVIVSILINSFLVAPPYIDAQLGQGEGQIIQDESKLGLRRTKTEEVAQRYLYHVLSSPGLVVKEYVDPKTRVVFAVSWRGTQMPDLLVLLGFDPAKLKSPSAGHSLHQSRIQTSTLLYESGGHMGFYLGRAIRTDLLPRDVAQTEVVP